MFDNQSTPNLEAKTMFLFSGRYESICHQQDQLVSERDT